MTDELTNAPADVRRLYADAMDAGERKGQAKAEAKKFAIRQVQLAGWYRTLDGWKRIAPDVRDKVNIRQAHPQPDGRYLITDVDIFYPNATKGANWILGDKAVEGFCKNTNRIITSGAQRPGLVEGHQHNAAKMLGVQQDSLGFAINFRPHPSKSGWARCDLVDVVPEAVERMRDRKVTGLSAEVAYDAGRLNGRFQRVSLLGGSIQSLSYLPVTEVYSVSNQLCFSADGTFPPRRQAHQHEDLPMPMDTTQANELAQSYSALSAAHASFAAGEEGADSKLDEAIKSHAACVAKYGGAGLPGDAELGGDTAKLPVEKPELASAAYSVGDITEEQFASDPVGVFGAMQTAVATLLTENKTMKAAATQAKAVAKKAADRQVFDTFIEDLHTKGHVFDDVEAIAMFDSAQGNDGLLKQLATFLKKSPTKKETGPADLSAIFSTEDVVALVPDPVKKPDAAKPADLGMAFSSEEAKAGDDVLAAIGM